ncbi:MAG TPA: AEC family transporter [Clostridiales bacterium]|nr:AEC family transporter [Clostridiales bacterium]HQP69249.1 AEC family transporter [Clostridiales bacterium]
MHNQIIIQQISILALLTLIGYVSARQGMFSDSFSIGLNKLIMKITLPLMIFTSLSKFEFSAEIFKSSVLVLIFAFISMFILLFAGTVSGRILKLPHESYTVHKIHTTFGNIAFLGYPLLDSLFPGGSGLLYAVIYHIAVEALLWTLGVIIFNRNKKISFASSMKHLINPNTIAFALGLASCSVSIKLSYVPDKVMSGLGGTTIYLSMIYIGIMLSKISIKGTMKEKQIYILTLNKMILVPFIMLMLINSVQYIFEFYMDEAAKSVVILQTATPCMATIVIMAAEFKSDAELAAKNVFLTTLLSVITLPVVYWLINIF